MANSIKGELIIVRSKVIRSEGDEMILSPNSIVFYYIIYEKSIVLHINVFLFIYRNIKLILSFPLFCFQRQCILQIFTFSWAKLMHYDGTSISYMTQKTTFLICILITSLSFLNTTKFIFWCFQNITILENSRLTPLLSRSGFTRFKNQRAKFHISFSINP